MSAVLSKTLKDKDMDRIFAEVPCTEDLGLSKPGQLRLFHLLVRDGKFYHEDLERWLYRNLSRYVFSRAMLEQFRKDDDLDAAIERAIQTMRENGDADEKGTGNELGEMLIYAFLEGKLSAPKLIVVWSYPPTFHNIKASARAFICFRMPMRTVCRLIRWYSEHQTLSVKSAMPWIMLSRLSCASKTTHPAKFRW